MKHRAMLTDTLHVASQLEPADIATLAKEGIKSLISNRPDNEDPVQPSFAAIAADAQRHGMVARHIPVIAGTAPTSEQITTFAQALAELPTPIMAFCRSGTRSTTIWALASAGKISVGTLLDTAKRAGYDLSRLENELWQLAGRSA